MSDLSVLRSGIPALVAITTEAREIQYLHGIEAAVEMNRAAIEKADDLISLITDLRIALSKPA